MKNQTILRVLDVVLSGIGLLLLCPILFGIYILGVFDTGSPLLLQERVGRYRRPFILFKYRTMSLNTPHVASHLISSASVTVIGAVLRRTKLDELPQLWNVLIGHMAIVGPRPLPCSEASKCEQWHRRRLDTKPGLTCTWQISKSRQISFSEWMRMDLKYTDSRTFFGDLRLIFKTAMAVFLGRVGH